MELASRVEHVAAIGLSLVTFLSNTVWEDWSNSGFQVENLVLKVAVTAASLSNVGRILGSQKEEFHAQGIRLPLAAIVDSCEKAYQKIEGALTYHRRIDPRGDESWSKLTFAVGGPEEMDNLRDFLSRARVNLELLQDVLNFGVLKEMEAKGQLVDPKAMEDLLQLRRELPLILQRLQDAKLVETSSTREFSNFPLAEEITLPVEEEEDSNPRGEISDSQLPLSHRSEASGSTTTLGTTHTEKSYASGPTNSAEKKNDSNLVRPASKPDCSSEGQKDPREYEAWTLKYWKPAKKLRLHWDWSGDWVERDKFPVHQDELTKFAEQDMRLQDGDPLRSKLNAYQDLPSTVRENLDELCYPSGIRGDPKWKLTALEPKKLSLRKRLTSRWRESSEYFLLLSKEKGPEPAKKKGLHDPERPTYVKVNRKYLSPRTLDYYSLNWEWSKDEPDYIIIKQWVPEADQDILFEHSKRLRDIESDAKLLRLSCVPDLPRAPRERDVLPPLEAPPVDICEPVFQAPPLHRRFGNGERVKRQWAPPEMSSVCDAEKAVDDFLAGVAHLDKGAAGNSGLDTISEEEQVF